MLLQFERNSIVQAMSTKELKTSCASVCMCMCVNAAHFRLSVIYSTWSGEWRAAEHVILFFIP